MKLASDLQVLAFQLAEGVLEGADLLEALVILQIVSQKDLELAGSLLCPTNNRMIAG